MPTFEETEIQLHRYCKQITECQSEAGFFSAFEKICELYKKTMLGLEWRISSFEENWDYLQSIYDDDKVLNLNFAEGIYSKGILDPQMIFQYTYLMASVEKQRQEDDLIQEVYLLLENIIYVHLYRAISEVEPHLELLQVFSKCINFARDFGEAPIVNNDVLECIDNLEPAYMWPLLHLITTFLEYENEEETIYNIFKMSEIKRYIERELGVGSNDDNLVNQQSQVGNEKEISGGPVPRTIDNRQEGTSPTEEEIFAQMDEIIGLKEVKEFIRELYSHLVIMKKRKELGLATNDTQTLHMIFKGNPGTGKTTFARIVSKLLQMVGYLREEKVTETDRSGLVAGYVGHTAEKTKQVVMDSLDGVLFIDEAYALGTDANSENGFGKEAIDTLVKLMDDNRERLVVILAGYSKDMEEFLNINPGLRSRFPNIIEFKDYSTEELLLIARKMYQKAEYILTKGAEEKIRQVCEEACKTPQFGNGRYVRNVFEKSQRLQSLRLYKESDLTKDKLMVIEPDDIEMV
ncbi:MULTISPECIES: AAA family ATPase [unclassified Paenibacillus]|uniref:AAA family ATPase n=1 Tax=unclassified Paenibacillus TaxID=185978 RepID=UPI00363D935A